MRRPWNRWSVLIAPVVATLAVAGCGGAPATEQHRPVALVYRGPAASCEGCSEAVAALLRRAPQHFVVRYVGPEERRPVTASTLRGATLYAQPGGDGSVRQAMGALGRPAARAIASYVRGGGHYVGFCMGAYLAGSDPGTGLLGNADTGGWTGTPGAQVTDARDAVVAVRWGQTTRRMFAQDAPYVVPGGGSGEHVLARFTNGRVAALVRPSGKGRVGVVGPHPEADRSWYSDRLWRQDRDGPDADLGLALVRAVLADRRGGER